MIFFIVPSIEANYRAAEMGMLVSQDPNDELASMAAGENKTEKEVGAPKYVKLNTKAVEIYVIESMLREVNPLIPADVRKFFPKEGGSFKLDVPEGYTIDAYMGNRGASNHIHSRGEKRFRIQQWLRNNQPKDGDILRFEKIDERHYMMSLLKGRPELRRSH